MAKQRFIYTITRNILAWGDDAPEELEIKGNVSELQKLKKLIDDAIEYALEADGKYEWEDDIDQQHVCITAYPDGKSIRKPAPDYNPFESFL